jgi:hypothetical protein
MSRRVATRSTPVFPTTARPEIEPTVSGGDTFDQGEQGIARHLLSPVCAVTLQDSMRLSPLGCVQFARQPDVIS